MSNRSPITALTNQLQRMPKKMRIGVRAVTDLKTRALRMTKDSPGRSVLGAFAIGFVVAKLARFV